MEKMKLKEIFTKSLDKLVSRCTDKSINDSFHHTCTSAKIHLSMSLWEKSSNEFVFKIRWPVRWFACRYVLGYGQPIKCFERLLQQFCHAESSTYVCLSVCLTFYICLAMYHTHSARNSIQWIHTGTSQDADRPHFLATFSSSCSLFVLFYPFASSLLYKRVFPFHPSIHPSIC